MKALAVIAALALMFGVACSDSDSASPGRGHKIEVADITVPGEVEGLRVQKEDIASALQKVNPSYVDETALFSFRSGDDVVQATLQVNHFPEEPRYSSSRFRRTIVGQLGGSQAFQTRMGKTTIWRSTGTNQTIAVWFDGYWMYLLSIRNEVDRPRALIRNLTSTLSTPPG